MSASPRRRRPPPRPATIRCALSRHTPTRSSSAATTGAATSSSRDAHSAWAATWRCAGAASRGRRSRAAADGAFALRLGARPAGQETLQVRSASRDPTSSSAAAYVGIGDIYVVAGQSNASGRGTSPNWYTHPVLQAPRSSATTIAGRSSSTPVDDAAGQVDRVSADPLAGGSVWPLLATELMAAEDVPVAFVPCAKGTTSIRLWMEDAAAPHSRRTLYGSMLRRVRAVGGRVRAVLFWQGEADARKFTSKEEYAAALRRLAAALARTAARRWWPRRSATTTCAGTRCRASTPSGSRSSRPGTRAGLCRAPRCTTSTCTAACTSSSGTMKLRRGAAVGGRDPRHRPPPRGARRAHD